MAASQRASEQEADSGVAAAKLELPLQFHWVDPPNHTAGKPSKYTNKPPCVNLSTEHGSKTADLRPTYRFLLVNFYILI